MRAVKYFIYDYEQSTGQRLVGLRRHVNSYIEGGGNVPSTQKPDNEQAAQHIVDGLIHYAATFDPNDEKQNAELQQLKPLLLLPDATGLPMQVVGKYGIQTKFDSWEDVKQFILEHKDFCLNPQRKQAFTRVLTNKTCSQAAQDLVESIVNTLDQLPDPIHQPQQDPAMDESEESDDEDVSPLPEGHSTPSSYSDDEEDMEEQPSSTNTNEVANEILGAILKKVYTQVERKQQLKEFIGKVQGIMKFYTMFALLPIRQQQKQKQQQIEQAKKQLIGSFQEWVSNTIHKTITSDMALSILARLVQMARKKQE